MKRYAIYNKKIGMYYNFITKQWTRFLTKACLKERRKIGDILKSPYIVAKVVIVEDNNETIIDQVLQTI